MIAERQVVVTVMAAGGEAEMPDMRLARINWDTALAAAPEMKKRRRGVA